MPINGLTPHIHYYLEVIGGINYPIECKQLGYKKYSNLIFYWVHHSGGKPFKILRNKLLEGYNKKGITEGHYVCRAQFDDSDFYVIKGIFKFFCKFMYFSHGCVFKNCEKQLLSVLPYISNHYHELRKGMPCYVVMLGMRN